MLSPVTFFPYYCDYGNISGVCCSLFSESSRQSAIVGSPAQCETENMTQSPGAGDGVPSEIDSGF